MAKQKPKPKQIQFVRIVPRFDRQFVEDVEWWAKSDRRVVGRILALVENIMLSPFEGIGKPEPLKYIGADVWSRRIAREHRLVYRVAEWEIVFLKARHHYA
ncbi:Txe/YoeB family addiction module toxin [Synechococcus sp. PCC 7336]|uniref:Txe/YoeB family addiction module toxin n=1 Tax=Synechococcus sp. PCC 7336 TaxID=195250 RepID=UPI0003786267|nr:Txe/YoeB family addiction module toxin [Synechococcus sp. PCC 7336]